jgi:hypothetical protein
LEAGQLSDVEGSLKVTAGAGSLNTCRGAGNEFVVQAEALKVARLAAVEVGVGNAAVGAVYAATC